MTKDSASTDQKPLSIALVGTWELRSREDYTTDGRRVIDPSLGYDPVALLVYDRTGHFTAQFMKRDRSSISNDLPSSSGPNNSRAVGGYDAYFGTYTVDDSRNEVTQTLTGSLSPENVGQVLTREMTVIGDELIISLETATSEGEPVTRTLRWQRVG